MGLLTVDEELEEEEDLVLEDEVVDDEVDVAEDDVDVDVGVELELLEVVKPMPPRMPSRRPVLEEVAAVVGWRFR